MTAFPAATLYPAELLELMESGKDIRVIDVRTPGEFDTVHIPGAYNVPLDLLREHRDEFCAHLDEDVVLVCRSGRRAVQAEEDLRAAGLINVHLLDGGMLGWEGQGLPVIAVRVGGISNGRYDWWQARSCSVRYSPVSRYPS